MRKNTNKGIDFNDAVITPLNQRVEIKMDLDDDIIDYLRYLSAKSNQSLDNIINHVLGDLCSKHLELKDVSAEEIKAVSKTDNQIIIMDENKPFARVEIITGEDKSTVSVNIPAPDFQDKSCITIKTPDMEHKYECPSAKRNITKAPSLQMSQYINR